MFNSILNTALKFMCLKAVMYFTLCKFSLVAIVHFQHQIFPDFLKGFFGYKTIAFYTS